MIYFKDLENKTHVLDSIEFIDLLPSGCLEITEQEFINLTTPPSPTIEQLRTQMAPLTALQIRKVLNQYNLRSQVEAAVSASTDQVLKDAWEFATEYKRDDALLNAMVTQLGMTQEQVDEMFQLGATL